MKLICPRCQYKAFVDAASVAAGEEVICARCGGSLREMLWRRSQISSLTTTTAAAQKSPAAPFIDRRIMENQNAYAPSAETGFEDVLEIPRPLLPAQQPSDQAQVLEDVIPAHELSATDELIEEQTASAHATEGASDQFAHGGHNFEETDPSVLEAGWHAGPEVAGAPQPSSFDYEGNRAWLRAAPLLLLVAVLVFLGLYYVGNRMGRGGGETATQKDAVSPAAPLTQSATDATAPAPAESAPDANATTSAVESAAESPVAAPAEVATETRDEKRKAEPANDKARTAVPPAPEPTAAPPAAASTASTAPVAPAADQATGNYTIQVGSYNDAAQANERAGQLRANGIEARVVRAELPRRGTWYRVQTGRFASHEEAERRAAELKGKGATNDFIITDFQSQ